MIDPSELESYGYGHEAIFADLEQRIINDVVRRIHDAGVITRSADFQLNQLQKLGFSEEDIKTMLESALNDSSDYVDQLYAEAIETDYIDNKSLYKALGKDFIPFKENEYLQKLIEDKKRKTIDDMTNMTKNLGFVVKEGSNLKSTRLSDFVNQTLNQAYVDITAGAFDYNTTLRKAVTQMTNSGVRWINYESGWHNRITVAARRSVMSSINDISREVSEQTAKDLGTDQFEVDAHANARPTHAVWQGGIFTKRGLMDTCGLGSSTGLCGINCYHTYYPFIPGVSKRAYTDEQLKKWRNPESIEYGGKEYTGYEATQKMRQMETNMRAQRQKIRALKSGGGSETDILSAQARYRGQMNEYTKFTKSMGLKTQKERIYIDGLGKQGKSVIIKVKDIKQKSLPYKQDLSAYKMEVASGAQRKHIQGTKEYADKQSKLKVTPSYITISESEVKDLVKKYSQTGINLFDKNGEWKKQEIIITNNNSIGYVANNFTGELVETDVFKIHYSKKKGFHIVPDYPSKKEAI